MYFIHENGTNISPQQNQSSHSFFKKPVPPMPRAQDIQLSSPAPQPTTSSCPVVQSQMKGQRLSSHKLQPHTKQKGSLNALKHSNIITKSNCLLACGIELLFSFLLFFNSLRTIKRVGWCIGLTSSSDNEEEF